MAADDGWCSRAGRDVLCSAVDADVAAALCLAVVSPASRGAGVDLGGRTEGGAGPASTSAGDERRR